MLEVDNSGYIRLWCIRSPSSLYGPTLRSTPFSLCVILQCKRNAFCIMSFGNNFVTWCDYVVWWVRWVSAYTYYVVWWVRWVSTYTQRWGGVTNVPGWLEISSLPGIVSRLRGYRSVLQVSWAACEAIVQSSRSREPPARRSFSPPGLVSRLRGDRSVLQVCTKRSFNPPGLVSRLWGDRSVLQVCTERSFSPPGLVSCLRGDRSVLQVSWAAYRAIVQSSRSRELPTGRSFSPPGLYGAIVQSSRSREPPTGRSFSSPGLVSHMRGDRREVKYFIFSILETHKVCSAVSCRCFESFFPIHYL